MRASPSILALLAAGLVACGGKPAPVLLDAPPPPPIDAFACSQKGTVGLNPIDFSKGTGQAQGAVPMNQSELTVVAVVTLGPAPTTTTPTFGLLVVQVNNAGVFGSAAGAAGRFEKPPAPGTYPMDGELTLGFGIEFLDGITLSASGGVSLNPMQGAVLDTTAGGTVKIDSWTPAATPSGTTTIGATVTNAKFKGVNVLPNGNFDPAGNGCDITLTTFQFTNLSVKWQPTPFPVSFAPPAPRQPDFSPRTIAGAAVVSADLSAAPQ